MQSRPVMKAHDRHCATTGKLLSLTCVVIALLGVVVWIVSGQKANRLDSKALNAQWLSRVDAESDLNQLQGLLEDHFSYLTLKGVDHKAELARLRSSVIGDRVQRGDFGQHIRKFLALFGDAHAGVANSSLTLKELCAGFSPFLVEEAQERFVAFKPDRSAFVEEDYPFLIAIDGRPVKEWLEVASQWVARGSPQFVRYRSIRNLRFVGCLRRELGLADSPSVRIELESADATGTKQVTLALAKNGPVYGFWPRPESELRPGITPRVEKRVLSGNIAYLRIISMFSDREFLDSLIEAMTSFRNTKGLIIDLRLCNGGSRAPLQVLFPFFMAKNDSPRVVNVAAYRLGTENIKEDFEDRFLYEDSDSRWSAAEREVVNRCSQSFEPEWMPPQGQFSSWHYFVISPNAGGAYFHYDKPTVILLDRWNFSACDIFLGAFKGWRNVTLMGLPSGGGSGCYQLYRLRFSQVLVRLSSMASFRANGKLYDGNGIQPDILLDPVPTDFIGRTDSTLKAATAWIEHTAD